MISTYNDDMQGADWMEQKTEPYCFDRKVEGSTQVLHKALLRLGLLGYGCTHIVNTFVIQEALANERDASKKHDPDIDAGTNRPSKTLLDFKRKLVASLLDSYTSRAYCSSSDTPAAINKLSRSRDDGDTRQMQFMQPYYI